MTKKRTSLTAVLGVETKPAVDTAASPPASLTTKPAGRRPGIKQQTAYLPEPVYEQLRKLAFDERRRMHDYILEGLDRVFRNRGLSSIEELTRKRV
jgi:hypothetical protein